MKEVFDLSLFNTLKTPDKILVLLSYVLLAGSEFAHVVRDPLDLLAISKGWDPEYIRGMRKYAYSQSFRRLLNKKFVEQKAENAEKRLYITKEGLDYLYSKFPIIRVRSKGFDGFWRIVVYDIDETERLTRQQLRSGLKKLGFNYFQQSVWLSPYAWELEFDEFFKKLNLGNKLFLFKAALPNEKSRTLLKEYWFWEKGFIDKVSQD